MIDSAEKRRAMLAFGRRTLTLPVATGSLGDFERMHLLGGYLLAAAPAAPVPVLRWEVLGVFVPGIEAAAVQCGGLEAGQVEVLN